MAKLFFLKKYGYFGKRKSKLKRLRDNFRRRLKLLNKRTFYLKRRIFEIMGDERKKANFIKNISFSRGWGDITKSFFFKKTFNSYLGWSKSKIYNFQLKLGEVV